MTVRCKFRSMVQEAAERALPNGAARRPDTEGGNKRRGAARNGCSSI